MTNPTPRSTARADLHRRMIESKLKVFRDAWRQRPGFNVNDSWLLFMIVIVLILYSYGSARAEATDAPSNTLKLRHVVDFIGFADVKPNSTGTLGVGDGEMDFVAGKSKTVIALRSISAFSIKHDNVALIGGPGGVVVGLAPYGAGMVFRAIRPGAEVLTLVYADDNRAVHGTVLILPKGRGADVARALAKAGLSPSEHPEARLVDSMDGGAVTAPPDASHGQRSVRVAFPAESVGDVPAAYAVGVYEELVAQLTRSGAFATVWRQGDARIDPDALTLHIDIDRIKKGNARTRALLPLTAPTVIGADIQLTDRDHTMLLQKNISGAVRLHGESMQASKNLAKNIRVAVTKRPDSDRLAMRR